MTNNDYIVEGFRLLLQPLSKYVCASLKDYFGDLWWNEAVMNVLREEQKMDLPAHGPDDECISSLDITRVITLMNLHWNEVFIPLTYKQGSRLKKDCRSWAMELQGVRNKSCHIGSYDFSERETTRALDTMMLLCECLDMGAANQIEELYSRISSNKTNSPEEKQSDVILNDASGDIDIETICEPSEQSIIQTNDVVFEDNIFNDYGNTSIDVKRLIDSFEGCIVRKDLTKKIKEGANVPIFVLEYLLGMYCSSGDDAEINEGLETVKNKLSRLYIRPDEAEKTKSNIKEAGEGYAVIDKVSVLLDYKKDVYVASFLSLGLKNVPIDNGMVISNPRLLSGGIWCIVTFNYSFLNDDDAVIRNPFKITRLSPIQMPTVDESEYMWQRKNFTKDEWISLMLRSIGIEPDSMSKRSRWLLLARIMPLVENNINVCELGPRSTGKSHIYKEISPSSILVSGGQTSVANLFYNMSSRAPGLVCNWDVVAFDEVAEIKFKDKDAITIMKDYMASGSFSRGKEILEGKASMVFIGNINENIDTLLLQASLFKPFPDGMNNDTAFLDRLHCYIPGWEIEPFSPRSFTNDYGFICDYFAEIARELRKVNYSDVIFRYFELDDSLKQRDVTSIKKMCSALIKIIYPDGKVDKEEVREILEFAMEMRSRVKEQLKRIQPDDEFNSARFIYRDIENGKSKEILVPECVRLNLKQSVE